MTALTKIYDKSSLHKVVGSETHLRRFGGHLDASLKDGDGKLWVWAAAEPETEIRVRL